MMKHLLTLCLLPLLAYSVSGQEINPYEKGPYYDDTISIIHYWTMYEPLEKFNVRVWAPRAEGNFPVFYFITGLQAVTPAIMFEKLLHHISSHGYVVVAIWAIAGELHPDDKGQDIGEVLQWARALLDEELAEQGFPVGGNVDYDNAFISCLSAGCRMAFASVKYAGCQDFKGAVLMSPVDGIDPFGWIDDYLITPGEPLPFAMPTLTLATGLDHVPGIPDIPGYPACADNFRSNYRFYNAMPTPPSPKWIINATDYGHIDALNEEWAAFIYAINFCAWDPDVPKPVFQSFVGGEVVAFLKTIVGDNCETYRQYLEDSSIHPVTTVLDYAAPPCSELRPFCERMDGV